MIFKLRFCILTALISLQLANATEWPPISPLQCSQTTKLKAMYGSMIFQPSLSEKPMTSLEVDITWDALEFHPNENIKKKGGVYVAYTLSMKGGPGGYFGVQITGASGQLIFSIWDGDRIYKDANGIKQAKKSSKLAWPVDMDICKRNCQDCAISSLRDLKAQGFTTGTKCIRKHPSMRAGDKYKVELKKLSGIDSIDTAQYGGFKSAHDTLGEFDHTIDGSLWEVSATVLNGIEQGKQISVGKIFFQSEEIGFHRLGTFDEMLGCNKCNAIYHKDTRSNLSVGSEDQTTRKPVEMHGSTKYDKSTCKAYHISGSKLDSSISFESGPLTMERSTTKKQVW